MYEWIYLCMYVCVYVRMYVRMYVCMYVCMYVWMNLCMYVCMYEWMNLCMYVWMNLCMYVCMCEWIYVCMYVCVNEFICACMYVCMYFKILKTWCLLCCDTVTSNILAWFNSVLSTIIFKTCKTGKKINFELWVAASISYVSEYNISKLVLETTKTQLWKISPKNLMYASYIMCSLLSGPRNAQLLQHCAFVGPDYKILRNIWEQETPRTGSHEY